MNDSNADWLNRLGTLNVSRSEARGPAPHKPLMMLTVIDLIESGEIGPDGWVNYGLGLVAPFRDYWELVLDRQRNMPEIAMPFHALGSDRDQVWECFTVDGTPSRAKATTRRCRLDPKLRHLLDEPDFRSAARRILISVYFTPREQVMLCARLDLPLPRSEEIAELRRDAEAFRASRRKGRDSRFKAEVLGGYLRTCAFTGYRLDTEQGTLVHAAHIHQHAKSGNDDPRNGLALTPDAHWMFDAGLWTAVPKGDLYVVEVAKGRFEEGSVDGRTVLGREGMALVFDPRARLRPGVEFLRWHRQHCFLGQA